METTSILGRSMTRTLAWIRCEYHTSKTVWFVGAGVVILAFVAGFFSCQSLWPRVETVVVEKEVLVPVKVQKDDALAIDLEIDRRARQRFISLMEQNWLGVLEVKDNEAQTVSHKRAALATKNRFFDLKNDVSYTVYGYFTHMEKGYGIAGDGKNTFFPFIWYPGATKAPIINPGTIRIPAGRRVEPGTP